MSKHDTSQPILVLIRRGRKGRGFSVSPVEDVSNISACANEGELGEVIREMLDDEEQPRVDINDLIRAASGVDEGADEDDEYEEDDDEDDDEEDEDPRSGTILDGVAEAADPTDRLIFNMLDRVVRAGQNASSKRVRGTGRRKKKKKKKKR